MAVGDNGQAQRHSFQATNGPGLAQTFPRA